MELIGACESSGWRIKSELLATVLSKVDILIHIQLATYSYNAIVVAIVILLSL